MWKAAYGITAALAVGVVIVELLHAPILIIFALTSLALISSRGYSGKRPRAWDTTPGRASAAY